MSEEDILREYYNDIPGLPPFDEAEVELRDGIRRSWGFAMYKIGREWQALRESIKERVASVLPKN